MTSADRPSESASRRAPPEMPLHLAMLFGLAKPHPVPGSRAAKVDDEGSADTEWLHRGRDASIESRRARMAERREDVIRILARHSRPRTAQQIAEEIDCGADMIGKDLRWLRERGRVTSEWKDGKMAWRAAR